MNDCTGVPCSICRRHGTYAFAKLHVLSHGVRSHIDAILEMTSHGGASFVPMSSIEDMSRQLQFMAQRLYVAQREFNMHSALMQERDSAVSASASPSPAYQPA